MGSSRLYGKSLMEICGKPLLYHVIARVSKAKGIDGVVVLTSLEREDDAIENFCVKNKTDCFRGSRDNVLKRFYDAALEFTPDIILRICGDNPLISIEIIEEVSKKFDDGIYDFVCGEKVPVGCSSEGFTFNALNNVYKNAKKNYHREHIVTYVMENREKFNIAHVEPAAFQGHAELRMTVDTREDLEFVRSIYERLYAENSVISLLDVFSLVDENPDLTRINSMVKQKNPYS